jgi:hypothetical protein
MSTVFDPLIGRTIKKILTDLEHWHLVFETTDGDFVFETQVSCCNEVWFNHVTLPVHDGIAGCVVLFIEEKPWQACESTRQDCEEAAFWTLMTTYGYIDIEVRNSHNGYYSGSVTYEASKIINDLTEITEDF